MFRVSLDNVAARRTCRPLYERHQATPYSTFLDANETDDIYSGMVMYRTGADTVALYDGTSATKKAFGLSALDKNDVIDDIAGIGIKPWAVWIGGMTRSLLLMHQLLIPAQLGQFQLMAQSNLFMLLQLVN